MTDSPKLSFRERMEAAAKKGLNSVQDFVVHPHVEKVTEVASMALGVAAQIGQAKIALGSPLGMVGAGLTLIEKMREQFDLSKPDPLFLYVQALEEEPGRAPLHNRSSMIPLLLEKTGALQTLDLRLVAESDDKKLLQIEDKTGKVLLIRVGKSEDEKNQKDKKVEKARNGSQDTKKTLVEMMMTFEAGFDMASLTTSIWNALGTTELKFGEPSRGSTMLSVFPMPDEEQTHVIDLEDGEIARLTQSIERFHARGISRAYVLCGVPGTGKTTRVRTYARTNKLRLLVVPPAALSDLQEVELWVGLLMPDVILFDDVDRGDSNHSLNVAINVIEDLRRKHPKIVTIATVNHLNRLNGALLRPGRLGKKMEFGIPNAKQKLTLLTHYMKTYGVKTQPYDLEALVAAMTHENFSHDYVRFVAEEAVVCESQDEMLAVVQELNDHLDFCRDEASDAVGAPRGAATAMRELLAALGGQTQEGTKALDLDLDLAEE